LPVKEKGREKQNVDEKSLFRKRACPRKGLYSDKSNSNNEAHNKAFNKFGVVIFVPEQKRELKI